MLAKLLLLFFLVAAVGPSTSPFDGEVGSYPHTVSIATIFQDEASFLKEWIDYHKLLGVTRFYLYNNLSKDHFLEVLAPYIEEGSVELIEWNDQDFPACQIRAYSDMIQRARGKTKWLALIDVDEFIVPANTDSLVDFLEEYNAFAAVVINWQLFGTSGVESLEEGAFVTEHLTRKFPPDFHCPYWNSNHFVKSVVRPERVDENRCTAHFVHPKRRYYAVDPDKELIRYPFTMNSKVAISKIQINHYWFRTKEWFFKEKLRRRVEAGYSYSKELLEWLFQIGSAENGPAITRFVERLKKEATNCDPAHSQVQLEDLQNAL